MINLFTEGVYVDLWSVPHFLFGFIVYYILLKKKIGLSAKIFVVILLAVLWEIFEVNIKVGEHLSNIVIDILLPVIALIMINYLYKRFSLLRKSFFIKSVVVLFIVINAYGWIPYVFL